MDDKSDKKRDDIAGLLANRDDNPSLSQALLQPQPVYSLPPGTPGANGVLQPAYQQPQMSLTPYAYGQGGSNDLQRRTQQPYGAVGMRLGVNY